MVPGFKAKTAVTCFFIIHGERRHKNEPCAFRKFPFLALPIYHTEVIEDLTQILSCMRSFISIISPLDLFNQSRDFFPVVDSKDAWHTLGRSIPRLSVQNSESK